MADMAPNTDISYEVDPTYQPLLKLIRSATWILEEKEYKPIKSSDHEYDLLQWCLKLKHIRRLLSLFSASYFVNRSKNITNKDRLILLYEIEKEFNTLLSRLYNMKLSDNIEWDFLPTNVTVIQSHTVGFGYTPQQLEDVYRSLYPEYSKTTLPIFTANNKNDLFQKFYMSNSIPQLGGLSSCPCGTFRKTPANISSSKIAMFENNVDFQKHSSNKLAFDIANAILRVDIANLQYPSCFSTCHSQSGLYCYTFNENSSQRINKLFYSRPYKPQMKGHTLSFGFYKECKGFFIGDFKEEVLFVSGDTRIKCYGFPPEQQQLSCLFTLDAGNSMGPFTVVGQTVIAVNHYRVDDKSYKISFNQWNLTQIKSQHSVTFGDLRKKLNSETFFLNYIKNDENLNLIWKYVNENYFRKDEIDQIEITKGIPPHKIFDLPELKKRIDIIKGFPEWSGQTESDRIVLVTADSYTIYIIDVKSFKLVSRLIGHVTPVETVCINFSVPFLLASGSRGGTVYIWSLKSHKPLLILRGHTQTVLALELIKIGGITFCFSGGHDQRVIAWDLTSQTPLYELSTGNSIVKNLSYDYKSDSLFASTIVINQTMSPYWKDWPKYAIHFKGDYNFIFSNRYNSIIRYEFGNEKKEGLIKTEWNVIKQNLINTISSSSPKVQYIPSTSKLSSNLPSKKVLLKVPSKVPSNNSTQTPLNNTFFTSPDLLNSISSQISKQLSESIANIKDFSNDGDDKEEYTEKLGGNKKTENDITITPVKDSVSFNPNSKLPPVFF